ncbi:thioesterase domain-containing protein [Streptomyces prunicolor]|uniref:thioesterase domain-containing protein n=1 Tax=Streptomyces prunicolor TaxID=67348 RepID=UPI0037D9A84B
MGLSWGYSGLLAHLGHRQPLYGLQARRFSEPDAGTPDLADMVEDYLSEIRRVQPQGPYSLLGWSFGGIVAHFVAVRLQAEGEEVALLSMMDSYLPTADREHERLASEGPSVLQAITESIGHDPTSPDSPLAGLGEEGFTALTQVFMDIARMSDGITAGTFRGDVLFFRATADKAGSALTTDDWAQHVTGRFEVYPVDCAHGAMTQPGPLSELGPVLAARLARRSEAPSGGRARTQQHISVDDRP